MSRIPALIFALALAVTALLLTGLLQTERADGHGVPHGNAEMKQQMNQGGTPDRHSDLLWTGGLYGGLQIVLLTVALLFGIRTDRSRVKLLLVAGFCYLSVFVGMVVTYGRGMESAPVVLGLPLPTALMVFGMWGTPALFVGLYVFKFRDWIYNEEDAQRFALLMENQNAGEASDG